MKKSLLIFLLLLTPLSAWAVTIGIHGLQHLDIKQITTWESQNKTTLPIIGLIFDKYGDTESVYLSSVVNALGTGRIYHISLSPYGHTAQEVADGIYTTEYKRFFRDMKNLDIRVVFRTMHEMNGWRYSRASHPDEFKKAWIFVYNLARNTMKIQSDKLLFSLSFNSQDLPTQETRPTQESHYEYCSQWRVDNIWRCPRMEDYYPGNQYVDMIGVTLYNRGRSRATDRSVWKSPTTLLTESRLIDRLSQRRKPISIDELWTTAVNFEWTWTQQKARESFLTNIEDKSSWLRERKLLFAQYPLIKSVVYFNLDATAWATTQVLGQADRNIIFSPYISDYREGKKFLTIYGDDTLNTLFKLKKRPLMRSLK
jgi:beta-mannanase